MPRSLKTFSLTLGLGLSLVSCLIIWEDPSQIWHPKVQYASHALSRDEVWVPRLANFPEREIRLAQMTLYPQPDLVVLGSSRAMLIDSELFRPGLIFQNLGVSGATIQDDIGFWQALKSIGKRPKYVVLCLDPWILNHKSGYTRWIGLLRYYRDFMAERQLSTAQRYVRILAEANALLRDYFHIWRDTWSWTTFKAALSLALYPHRRDIPSSVLPARSKPSDASAYRADGAFVYPDSVSAKKPVEEIENRVREVVLKGEISGLSRWVIDPSAIEDLDLLLQDMSKDGTYTIIILPPYHPLARQLISARPGYKNVIEDSQRIFEKVSDQHFGIEFCNPDHVEAIGCRRDEFLDDIHMSYGCVQKVVNYCLERSTMWRPLLKSHSS